MFGRPRRQVPTPERIGPHTSSNPLFSAEPSGEWAQYRQRVWWATGLTLTAAAIGFLIYGPTFRLTELRVSGTRLVTPSSVERVANAYLDRQRWLIFPNRTLWILSSHGLAQYLQKAINQRLSIEGVDIKKIRPHTLVITIRERTPVAIWTDGASFGTVDRQGVIIERRAQAQPDLTLVLDENKTSFTVDTSVAKREVMMAIVELGGALKNTNIEFTELIVPVPFCPPPPSTTSNTNSATNVSNANTNLTTNTSNNANGNTNSVTTNSAPIIIPCNVEELRYSSPEIHAQLKDGPRVLFDRHNDIQQAVAALQRVLSQPGAQQYQQVDVRFGDRVYVK